MANCEALAATMKSARARVSEAERAYKPIQTKWLQLRQSDPQAADQFKQNSVLPAKRAVDSAMADWSRAQSAYSSAGCSTPQPSTEAHQQSTANNPNTAGVSTGGAVNQTSSGTAAQPNPCNVTSGLKAGGTGNGLFDKVKNMFGSSLGQEAFKHVSGKLPKIEVDANVNSNVRALVDAVNSGASSFAGSTLGSVMGDVYSAAGIDPSVLPANPNDATIFQNGEVAANFLADKMIGGVIEEADLPAPIGALSSMAFVQQNSAQAPQDITDPGCGISAYARDLIAYAPKHNFMFMVQFEFQPDYNDLNLQRHDKLDKEQTIKFHYLCREMDRPTIEVEYDDVNMYNYRTKVAKKVNYQPVNMKLVDDIQNSTMVFLEKYLKARSPVASMEPQTSDIHEKEGMFWTGWDANTVADGSGSMGGLLGPNKTVLRRVVVYHIFNYGSRVNRYTYINPKIMEFNMSQLSMDNHEPSHVDLQMGYDSVFIETDIPEAQTGVAQLQERSQLGTRQILKHGPNPGGG